MQDLPPRDESVHGGGVADDGGGLVAYIVGGGIHDDLTPVDDEHALDEVGDLVDQVTGEDDGTRVLGVVLEQPVVEDLAGDGIPPQVRLVEEGHFRSRCESDDDADCRELSARELLDAGAHREAKVGDEAIGELLVPVGVEELRRREGMDRLRVVGVTLAFANEAQPAQHPSVLVRVLTEHAHVAGGGEVLRREDRHHGGLARAVAPEQAVDGVLLNREAHIVDRDSIAVALGEVLHLDHRLAGTRGGCHIVDGHWSPSVVVFCACSRSSCARSSEPSPSFRASAKRGVR